MITVLICLEIMLIENLHEGIIYYKNIISNTKNVIKIIEETNSFCTNNTNLSPWKEWYSSTDSLKQYGFTKSGMFSLASTKDSNDFDIFSVAFMVESISKFAINNYCSYYNMPKPWLPNFFEIKKYIPGADMGPHIDSSDPTDIKHPILSGVIYLNDNYEGGEINFPNQNLTIKPEAGSLIVFPSSDPYLHHPQKIISGNKYMIPLFWFREKF